MEMGGWYVKKNVAACGLHARGAHLTVVWIWPIDGI